MTDANHTPASKKCTKCNQVLDCDSFHKNRTTADGLQHACKLCAKAARKRPDPDSVRLTRAIRCMAKTEGAKPCSKCGEAKPMTSEHWTISPRGLGGLSSECKPCQRQRARAKKSPEHLAMVEEKERLRLDGKKRCPACATIKGLDCFIRRKPGGVYSYCHECIREKSNAQRLNNPDADRQKKLRSWRKRIKENGDVLRAARNQWRNEKRAIDPLFAMECRVRGLIGSIMRRATYTKRSRTHEILGCDWEFFKAHIERQFTKGMTWENRSEWHLDHIVPLASAKTEEDVIALNHFTNLRPMWASENILKRDSITHLI